MTFLTLMLTNAAVVFVFMLTIWAISVYKRDASIVDPCWGLGFVIIAVTSAYGVGLSESRSWLLVGLTAIWGLRLSGYLAWRNHGKGEDRRYGNMRQKHGESFWWISLFTVFLLQGVLMWFISLPIQSGVFFAADSQLGWVAIVGVVLWSIGFFFESVGDYQMAQFKAQPDSEGKVMNRGLWSFTRHPNYFGDFCIWWGIFLMAGAAGSWWTIGSPLLMSFFLMKVSGVTLLENDIEERRPDYAKYKQNTNAFFPGPPRQQS